MLPSEKFRTAKEAASWLRIRGYKVSDGLFSQHKKAGYIPRGDDGTYSQDTLLGYAAAHLQLTAKIEDREARAAAVEKLSADSVLKAVRAERERLRLERERGSLMPVADHESDLAARAVFFKSEIESFILRKAIDIIRLTGGREDSRDDLILWWETATAEWLDAYSADRDFNADDEQDDAPPASTRIRDTEETEMD